MTTLVHHSPLGPLVIAGVPGRVAPGEHFEVTPDQAETLLEQDDLFSLVDGPADGYDALTVRELRELLTLRQLPTGGRTKAELTGRLRDADAAAATDLPDDPAPVVETGQPHVAAALAGETTTTEEQE